MGLITILPFGTQDITTSESDTISFVGIGTLNIMGTAQAPINVTLSSVASAGLAATIVVTNAHVILSGAASASLNTTYKVGDGGILDFDTGVDVALDSRTQFIGTTGRVTVGSAVGVSLLNSFSGFGPGKTIDFSALGVDHIGYTDAAGTNTGGTLTLFNSANTSLGIVAFTDGEFAEGNFGISPDGATGSLLDFASYATGITATPDTAALGPNGVVTFTVTMSNPTTVIGSPALVLDDGGQATYDPAASTSTQLAFTYTVAPGQNTPDLAVTAIALNGATLAPVGGGVVNLAAAIANPLGTLAVDTTAPVINAITTSPGSGYVGTGEIISFDVVLSEAAVLSNGSPSLLLSDGGTAVYDAASSTASNLVFRHIVQAGQNSADLAILGAGLSGGTIADLAGNELSLASFVVNPIGTLSVDTAAPTLTSVSTSPGSGALVSGQSVTITVTASESVLVSGGTPTLSLSDGGTALYDAASSTASNLVFSHTIQPGQVASDLSVVGASLDGASIADLAGNSFDLASVIGDLPGILSVGDTTGPANPGGPTTPTTPTTPTSPTTPTTTTTLPVYRFFESTTGTHFYTTDANERDTILRTRPDLISEGVGLRAINPANDDPAAVEVFRFFDIVKGTQFLTASQTERDEVIANRPDLKFEPAGSFFEHVQPQASDTPVYRFFSSTDGTHFYTDSATERATIIQTRPDLIAEGVGFYEPKA